MTHLTNTPDRLSDYLPDPRRPAISDTLARNLFFQGAMQSSHSTLSVGNTQTLTTDEPLRIVRAQVENVTGGTVTVQVIVDGRDLFNDASRPVSDAGSQEATDIYIVPAGSVVQTVIEATSGVPAGTAGVVLDTEPFVMVPTTEDIELEGRDRLRVSRRREIEGFNVGGTNRLESAAKRLKASISSGSAPPADLSGTIRSGTIAGRKVNFVILPIPGH